MRRNNQFFNYSNQFLSALRSSFSDFGTSRYTRDERWKAIDKGRERENLFNDYLEELRRKEKDEKHLKKEQVRESNHFPLAYRTDEISLATALL